MWTIKREVEDYEMEDFKNIYYLEYEYLTNGEKIEYFLGGIK
jgi:hypothetical protein